MILLRDVQLKDVDSLYELSQIPGFINLPRDRELIKEKVEHSRLSFLGEAKRKQRPKFIFVAEDLDTGEVVGTGMIASKHGTEESPHFYFQIGSEEKFSTTINTGFIHGTLQLVCDTDGPSEIGGLVVNPNYRAKGAHVGRQVSFVRFLFLSQNRNQFEKNIIAELLPPLNIEGQSPLWEAIGRRFTNMDYWEADALCADNKEFILSLFPEEKIYTTFLPPEARSAIGKVDSQTEPVMHMLKKIGFEYHHQIDPFDGGPHLWAEIDRLKPLKNAKEYTFVDIDPPKDLKEDVLEGLISAKNQKPGSFQAMNVKALIKGDRLILTDPHEKAGVMKVLELKSNERVIYMPYY
jgi:arginine N-succinyltransferase